MMATRNSNSPPGVAVDAAGTPAVDPTANVIALTEAANKRQDDLREAHQQLMKSELCRLEHVIKVHAKHARQFRDLEADRLKNIRLVDVQASATATEQARNATQALATVTTNTAETLRATLTTTATTLAAQNEQRLAATAAQISQQMSTMAERVSALEKGAYERSGRQLLADPMQTELMAKIAALGESRAVSTGRSSGSLAMWAAVGVGVSMLVSIVSTLIMFSKMK